MVAMVSAVIAAAAVVAARLLGARKDRYAPVPVPVRVDDEETLRRMGRRRSG